MTRFGPISRGVRLAGCGVLVALGFAQDSARDVPAPPRVAIEGLTGFLVDSRVEDLVNGQSFQLETVHVFDDRCRTRRFLVEKPALRDFEYRLGDSILTMRLGKASRPADAVAAGAMILRMELHRAVFLWPAGFEWSESEEGIREAPVLRARSDENSEPVGFLVAEADANGRLERMTAFNHEGLEAESYAVLEHATSNGRTWPKRLQLSFGGTTRWNEEVTQIRTRIKRSDLSFVPPDRRPPAPPGILSMDLLSFTFRRVALPEGTGWEAARKRYGELLEEARKGAPDLDFDPAPTFELGPDALPTTCLLRLRAAQTPPPEGWQTRPEMSGLAVRNQKDPAAITARQLKVLSSSVPPGHTAELPYARLLSYQTLDYVDLYLPFQAP